MTDDHKRHTACTEKLRESSPSLICISLEIAAHEGAFPRLFDLIERRGFLITAVSIWPADPRQKAQLIVTPNRAGRCPDLLCVQIAQLLDVSAVAIVANDAPSARGGGAP